MAAAKERIEFDPRSFLAKLNGDWSSERFSAGETIYSQGDFADTVFYLKSGSAKVTVTSKSGKGAVPSILEPGEFFGVNCLIGIRLRRATVSATTNCVVLLLRRDAMMRALRDEPDVSMAFISYLLHRSNRAQEDIVAHHINSSEKRLARLLMRLASYSKDGKLQLPHGKVSQEALAEMVGTTRSRISYFMNNFRRLGYIDYDGDVGDMHVYPSLFTVLLEDDAQDGYPLDTRVQPQPILKRSVRR